MDLALWLGPRISLKPVLEEPYQEYIAAMDAAMAEMNAEEELEPDERIFFDHYFLLLGIPPFLGMPSIISNPGLPREVLAPPFGLPTHTIQIETPVGLLVAFILSVGGNIAIFSIFSVLIATSVDADTLPQTLAAWAGRVGLVYLQFSFALMSIVVLMFLLFFPFLLPSMFVIFTGLAGNLAISQIASAIAMMGLVFIFWLGTFIVFTGHGVALKRKNIAIALWDSIRIVQWNTSSTLFMLLAVMVLYVLSRLLWFTAPTDSPATLIAIVGNAFVSTGLLAATYIYFQDRYRFWEEMRAHLKEQLDAKRSEAAAPK